MVSYSIFKSASRLLYPAAAFAILLSKSSLSYAAGNVPDTSICFDNPDNYANPHVYYWDAAPAGTIGDAGWPGPQMTAEDNFYCYDLGVSPNSISIIFNDNGAPQTGNLQATQNASCYEGGVWKSLQDCGFNGALPPVPPAAVAAETSVYFKNDANYAAPHMHYFNVQPALAESVWPGPAMESLGGLWYRHSYDAVINTAGIVFNDNGNGQTGNLNFDAATPCFQGGNWVSMAACEFDPGPIVPPTYNYPAGEAVFFFNQPGWQPPTAYIWDAVPLGSTPDGAWPGVAMTEFGDNFWFVDINDTTVSGKVIFSDTGNNQTPNQDYTQDLRCFKDDVWMTLDACGIPAQATAEAGPDRQANRGSRLALSALASQSNTQGATWESDAWTGTLTGASVVTPALATEGSFVVTMTLADSSTDQFTLTVVNPVMGLPERPLLAAPLTFPVTGSVSSGTYEFSRAFPNITGNFKSPVMVTPDAATNLVYVVDKQGTLSVFPYDQNVSAAQVVTLLDIKNEVRDFNEQGLLSMVFHPNFAQNGYVYIFYIEGENDDESSGGVFDDAVVQRITLNSTTNPTGIVANSRVEVLRIPQTGPDHKGSKMAFHPVTGLFYMGLGDGAYGDTAIVPTDPDRRTNNSGQDPTTLRGKFIRIDMQDTPVNGKYYTIPSDNPFVNDPNVLDEIWTFGHRNPWRWEFDSEAPHTLWAAEVGQQGANSFEEVNIIEKGKNYGWPICEGAFHRGADGGDPGVTRACTGDLEGPVSGYQHTGNDQTSIIGGFVYRGQKFPDLFGAFLFGDYDTKQIWGVRQGEDRFAVGTLADNISGFSTDPSGEEIFIQTHTYDKNMGLAADIYQLEDNGAQAAVIPATLSETGLFADLTERFPAHGVIEYELNSDGWFDGAEIRHFVSVPNNEKITFNDIDTWDLPVGSVLVKHVEIAESANTTRAFETSVLFRQVSGWAAANYLWNAAGTDADRVDVSSTVTVQQFINGQTVNVSRAVREGNSCVSCHVGSNSVDPRSFHTRQLNEEFSYQGISDNQLDVFNDIDLFTQVIGSNTSYQRFVDPESTSADINLRARTYLDTNCAGCHGGGFMDMRFDTPLNQTDLMNVEKSGGSYRLRPFDHDASLLYTFQVSDSNRMPKGTTVTNTLADQLFTQWIDATTATQVGLTVNVAQPADEIREGIDLDLSAMALYSNDFELDAAGSVAWSSTNSSVVSVSGTTARIVGQALSQGSTTISAVAGGQTANLLIDVGGGAAQPTNFSATGLSASAISLSWTDNSTDETQFILARANSASGPFTQIATPGANVESYVDSNLSPETTYHYQLKAVSADGESLPVTTFGSTTEAGGVESVTVTGGSAQVNIIGGETRQLAAVSFIGVDASSATLSATWTSSNNNIVSVSNTGAITGGNTAGDAVITATVEGVPGTLSVTNQGPGNYIYFNNDGANWDPLTVHIFSTSGGVETDVTAWPGAAMEPSPELGGKWYRHAILAADQGSDQTEVIFNCAGGGCQTGDVVVNFNTPWFEDVNGTAWLNALPNGGGAVTAGTQIVVGRGALNWAGNTENLSGSLLTPGAFVDVIADDPGTGQAFVRWEGTAARYLLDPKSQNTKMVVPDVLSVTLNAVFETIVDEFKVGRDYYRSIDQGCASCHALDGTGNGNPGLLDVTSKYTLASLTTYIELNMPQGNGALCTGECASSTAAMIFAGAYDEPEGLCRADNLDDIVPQDRAYRLLTVEEYNNSVKDLLGLSINVDVTSGRLPPDIPVNGFKTSSTTVFTDDYAKGYVTAAEAVSALAGDSISGLQAGCASGDVNCFVRNFGKRVFRRPLSTVEVNEFVALQSTQGDRGLLVGLFSAPAMLYRSEVGTLVNSGEFSGYYQLSDYEVAAMLSYTYWATTPDASLMAAADAGELSTPEQISTKVQQMMSDPRAEEAFERFVFGWLDLDQGIRSNELSDSLKGDMKEETMRFVKDIVFGGGLYGELITADYSYMTEQLANHYELPWPGGSGWQQVFYSGQNSERRGLLGHASILSIQSAQEQTHPVKRGLFVRSKLMCQDFPPPPLGAALDPEIDPTQGVRHRYETSHAQPGCDACHQFIDGIGFGLESYNAIGKFVTTETTGDGSVLPIDATGYIGSLNSAETFLSESEPVETYSTLDELATLIAGSSNAKACYARQWYRYTRGQREEPVDACTLEVFGKTFKESNNVSMLDLMIQFTQTKNYTLRK